MRQFTKSLFILCMLAVGTTGALACSSRYDPATGTAFVRCLEIVGDPSSYDVLLQDRGDGNFRVDWVQEFGLANPLISSLRITLTPRPAAIVFGLYSSGCERPFLRPTITETGNNIDIRVTSRFPAGAVCTAMAGPFVEAVSLMSIANPTGRTYSVNGVPIVPSFF